MSSPHAVAFLAGIEKTCVTIASNGDCYSISISGDRGAEIVGAITRLLVESCEVYTLDSKITVGDVRPRSR